MEPGAVRERLESIDACERLFRDTPTRYSTDNIGLARAKDGLELVRIGQAQRPEFAGWRYGEQYRRRRRNAFLLGAAGVAAGMGAIAALSAFGFAAASGGYLSYQLVKAGWDAGLNRQARFLLPDPDPAARETVRLDRSHLKHATISWEDGTPSLDLPHPKHLKKGDFVLSYRGADLQSVGRRAVAGLNLLVGGRSQLQEGSRILAENHGDLSAWLRRRTYSLTDVPGFRRPEALVELHRPIPRARQAQRWRPHGPRTLDERGHRAPVARRGAYSSGARMAAGGGAGEDQRCAGGAGVGGH
ncbi:MAG: hypothetical protein IPG05_11835 [Gemmatimonadetes bacterium]|nr:hypothetical protein [Gemmatimonadota bacterium]